MLQPTNASTYYIEKQTQEDRLLRITNKIKSELIKVGISPKAKGFSYLCDAIRLYMNDTSHVTQEISKLYKKSEPSIERAMQNAINKAWSTADTENLLKYYTAIIHSDKGVPTLLEFISYYVKILKSDF